jgi:hypothetical protein
MLHCFSFWKKSTSSETVASSTPKRSRLGWLHGECTRGALPTFDSICINLSCNSLRVARIAASSEATSDELDVDADAAPPDATRRAILSAINLA